MSQASERDEDTRLRLPSLALALGAAAIAICIWLLFSTLAASQAREADADSLLASENAISNVVSAQREALSLVARSYQWLAGEASRRDVQINRATLANRLDIVGIRGSNPVTEDTEFLASLKAWDDLLDKAPPGVLDEAGQVEWAAKSRRALDELSYQSKQISKRANEQVQNDLRSAAARAADAQRQQTLLVILGLTLASLTLALIARSVRQNYRRTRNIIDRETVKLDETRRQLDLKTNLERGQADVLESIAKGTSLRAVFQQIATLVSESARGRPAAIIYGEETVSERPEGMIGVPAHTVTFFSDTSEVLRGTLSVWGDSSYLSDEERGACERGADLARIAIDRERSAKQLLHQAEHDALTNLPNRAKLVARLRSALTRGESCAILFCDLDRFKVVNDSLGHGAGDLLLIEAGQRLSRAVRAGDLVARIGGDEFVILCTGIRSKSLTYEMAGRINDALSEPFHIHEREIFVSTSIGLTFSRPDGSSTETTLLREADMAMYKAKDNGRAQWQEFDEEMATELASRLERESSLRRAIERGELKLLMQPVIDMSTREVTGFEALLRWNRGGAEYTGPGDFIPLAEETGSIVPIGRWALDEAIRHMAEWRRQGIADGVTMAVNVSGRQLMEPDFAPEVLSLLSEHGLDPRALVLELTESTLIEAGAAQDRLSQLRTIGVRVALDDFGTGYSSLTQLGALPVDVIKLDRSFVNPLASEGKRQREFIAAVVSIAGALDLDMVVEGVETEEERRSLVSLGCRKGQGYLFGRPAEVEAAEALLRDSMGVTGPGSGRTAVAPPRTG